MKINKIYDESKQWENCLSEAETRKVADILEHTKLFEDIILWLRENYKIPRNGYSFEKDLGTEEYQFEKRGKSLNEFFSVCELLNSDLKLPHYWYGTIAYFAMFNVFITPEREPLEIKRVNIENGKKELHIIIKENMSITKLKDYVDEFRSNIEDGMKDMPKAPKHKMLRSELGKEIDKLKTEEKKTFNEIADILQHQYKNSDISFWDTLNEANIKMIYYRWKRLASK